MLTYYQSSCCNCYDGSRYVTGNEEPHSTLEEHVVEIPVWKQTENPVTRPAPNLIIHQPSLKTYGGVGDYEGGCAD